MEVKSRVWKETGQRQIYISTYTTCSHTAHTKPQTDSEIETYHTCSCFVYWLLQTTYLLSAHTHRQDNSFYVPSSGQQIQRGPSFQNAGGWKAAHVGSSRFLSNKRFDVTDHCVDKMTNNGRRANEINVLQKVFLFTPPAGRWRRRTMPWR